MVKVCSTFSSSRAEPPNTSSNAASKDTGRCAFAISITWSRVNVATHEP
jgi:hypothetical protein